MSFTYVNPKSQNQESNQAYTDLCKLLNTVESIDNLNVNNFLSTYLHSSPNEQFELDQLESKLSKLHQKLNKVKDAITLRFLNRNKEHITTGSVQTYTIQEAARKLKMSKSTLWRLVKKGLINCAWKNPERKRSPIFSDDHLNEFLHKK